MKFELEEYHRNTPSEIFLTDIRHVASELNKNSVTTAECQKHGKYHPATIQNRFGSWSKALEAAGLEINRLINISDEELFKNLEDIWTKLGRQPKYNEIKNLFQGFLLNHMWIGLVHLERR